MDELFCKNLRYFRTESNLTQKQVAKKLGVVESCYANWEQGRTEPSISSIRKICKILDITIDDLFNFGQRYADQIKKIAAQS